MEHAAKGAFILRTRRDADLAAFGGTAESLALIGGGAATTPEGAVAVAVWLSKLAAHFGIYNPAAAVYQEVMRDQAPEPGAHIFRARTVAGQAMARQLAALALYAESERQDRNKAAKEAARLNKETPPPDEEPALLPPAPETSAYIGPFLANLAEAAEVSDTLATLYRIHLKTATAPTYNKNAADTLKKALNHTANQAGREDEPETPRQPRPLTR
jgi:hypothetical protein